MDETSSGEFTKTTYTNSGKRCGPRIGQIVIVGRLTLENVRMFKMPSNSCFSLFAKQYVVQNNKTIL